MASSSLRTKAILKSNETKKFEEQRTVMVNQKR